MKLSEKLAALDDVVEEPRPKRKPRPAIKAEKPSMARDAGGGDDDQRPSPAPRRPSPKRKATARSDDWSASKRKVRQLVLEEIVPKSQRLSEDELAGIPYGPPDDADREERT